MKNKKTFIGVAVLLAVLMLGIGYAAFSGVTLNITGTASGQPNSENFNVRFDSDIKITGQDSTGNAMQIDSSKIYGTIIDDTGLKASLNISGLTAKGETVTAVYTILNDSDDLSASLSLDKTDSSDANFDIKATIGETLIGAKKSTTVTITVKMLVTPIDGSVSKDIDFSIIAEPEQP